MLNYLIVTNRLTIDRNQDNVSRYIYNRQVLKVNAPESIVFELDAQLFLQPQFLSKDNTVSQLRRPIMTSDHKQK